MKKKFLLIFINLFILNAPMFVLAASKPLTCTYGSDKNAYRFMLIQNSDGSHETKYILLDGNVSADASNIDLYDQRWTANNAKINLESDVLTVCPSSADRNLLTGSWTLHSDASGSFKLAISVDYSISEKTNQDEEAGINTNQVFDNVLNSTCSSNSNYKTCTYEDVIICFNNKDWNFEFNGDVKKYKNFLGVKTDFNLSTFLAKYNNGGCPSNIYTDDQQGVIDTYLHVSLTNSDGSYETQKPDTNLSGNVIPFNPVEPQSCESLLGDPNTESTPAYYLTKAFQVLKYAAIVILIVMSVIDFVTATVSNDKDAIMKATRKTIVRLVLCVIIFLLPYLIKVILKYLNDRAIDLCGIE